MVSNLASVEIRVRRFPYIRHRPRRVSITRARGPETVFWSCVVPGCHGLVTYTVRLGRETASTCSAHVGDMAGNMIKRGVE